MDARPLPARPDLGQYRKQAKELVKACRAEGPEAVRAWATRWVETWADEFLAIQAHLEGREAVPIPRARIDHEIDAVVHRIRRRLGTEVALTAAQFFIAREHGFDSWPKFAAHVEALAREHSPDRQFESAVDAIVQGDLATLGRLLAETPALIRARSSRKHAATLLHYVGANGVEDYRQKTPANAVAVLDALLAAGAEVDAIATMYRKDTTLELVATSVHPLRAGVQQALMQRLLDAGAAIDGAPGSSIVNACLANGRGEAAAYLAGRGAALDLAGAAGVGRLDLVDALFEAATPAARQDAFGWACEYGRDAVVERMITCGIDLASTGTTGQTGLHWAVIGNQRGVVEQLLAHGAPLEIVNCHGGTVLDQAMWCVEHGPGTEHRAIVHALVAAGADLDATPVLRAAVEAFLAGG